MTYREMLKRDHPEEFDPAYGGGCLGCPGHYYPGGPVEDKQGCHLINLGPDDDDYVLCASCWDQEEKET